MHVWWRLVCRSTTLWAGVLIAVIEVWLALSSMTPGVNLWADRVSGLSTASLFTGVITAGVSALEAGRWSAVSRVHSRSAARTPAVPRLLHASAAATPILAGYLTALLLLSVYALVTGSYGAPSPLWLAVLGCALLGAVAFGWTVGSLGAGRWWVAPAAAMLFFGGYISVQVLPLPNGIRALYPVLLVQDFVFVTPVLSTFLGIAAVAVGISVLALLLIGRGWRSPSRSRLAAASAAAGVLVLLGVGASLSRDGRYVDSFAPHDVVCSTGRVEICLNRGYAAALPALTRQVTTMNGRTAGTPLQATRLEQNIEGDPAPTSGARSVHIEQITGRDDITLAVYRYITQYGISETCRNNGSYSTGARAVVDSWLSGFDPSSRTPTEERAYRNLRALPVPLGNAWFRSHYRQYSTCTLRLSDLP